jgi:predicted RNA-binding protein
MLEISSHDGPGRLGKWNGQQTPLIVNHKNINLIKDQPMPYNVPREMAEWSVEQTLIGAKKSPPENMAVIQGSRYLELRKKCAIKLEQMGFRNFLIANIDDLLRRPYDLVEMIVGIRETLSPNSSIYLPFCQPNFIPLLNYMGVDLVGDVGADYYALQGIMLTPDMIYDLKEYPIFDLKYDALQEYNLNTYYLVIREVRAHMKNGTLRNLVEMRCATAPETMSALRILDRDYSDFTVKYTPLY